MATKTVTRTLATRTFSGPLTLIRQHGRAYAYLNLMAYGLLVAGMILGALRPELNAMLTGSMDESGQTGLVVSLLARPWLFALVILGVNLGKVALGFVTLPSMVVPFAGIPVFAYWAFTTGIVLAPVDHNTTMTLIPHSLTMVIELQAYVLLLLGAYVLGLAWVRPASVGVTTRRRAWVRGLRLFGRMWVPALALFVVGAVYEAYSLRYLLPLLINS
ncbi:MAG: stage II sporulation protein M [Nocardioides sp.]|nr:stage II sporulation protein M [Nocardioides sp.]